jgi:hypothetical protein
MTMMIMMHTTRNPKLFQGLVIDRWVGVPWDLSDLGFFQVRFRYGKRQLNCKYRSCQSLLRSKPGVRLDLSPRSNLVAFFLASPKKNCSIEIFFLVEDGFKSLNMYPLNATHVIHWILNGQTNKHNRSRRHILKHGTMWWWEWDGGNTNKLYIRSKWHYITRIRG